MGHSLGWGLPWAVRVRVAELLMSAGFDAMEAGQPIAEQQQLVHVLRHHLWPLLGLPSTLHNILNAWAYLRQFALTGEPSLVQLLASMPGPRDCRLVASGWIFKPCSSAAVK